MRIAPTIALITTMLSFSMGIIAGFFAAVLGGWVDQALSRIVDLIMAFPSLILALVGLSDKAHAYARTLSGGMRRRLLLGKALVHRPNILVLDEPTAGVDIELRQMLWSNVRKLNEQGMTIILTTHYLEEAENLCRHVAIIDEGRIIEDAPMSTVLRKLEREVFVLSLRDPLSAVPHNAENCGATLYAESAEQSTEGFGPVLSFQDVTRVHCGGVKQ